jgi:hypothetical protein
LTRSRLGSGFVGFGRLAGEAENGAGAKARRSIRATCGPGSSSRS